MKKTLFLLSLLALSCNDTRTLHPGYVVYKEYELGHFCHQEKIMQGFEGILANVVIPPRPVVVPHVHHHTWTPSQFYLYVADKTGVYKISVDSLKYVQTKVGDIKRILY